MEDTKFANPEAYDAAKKWIADNACATREDAYIGGWAAGFERGHITSISGPPEITADEADYMNGYRVGYRWVAEYAESRPVPDMAGQSPAWQYGFRSGRDIARGDVPDSVVGLPDGHPGRMTGRQLPAAGTDEFHAWTTGYVDARAGRPYDNDDEHGRPDTWQLAYRAGFDAGIADETGGATILP